VSSTLAERWPNWRVSWDVVAQRDRLLDLLRPHVRAQDGVFADVEFIEAVIARYQNATAQAEAEGD
jgi:hypothetical protein